MPCGWEGWLDLAAGLLTHVVGPAVAPLHYWAAGRGDFFVSKRGDRPLLFLPGVASYAAGFALFVPRGFTSLAALEAASFIASLVLLAATLEWKVSVHTAAATIPAILLPAIGYAIWLLSLLAVPLVAWARVRLGAHDWKQAAAGAAVGAAAAALGLTLTPPQGPSPASATPPLPSRSTSRLPRGTSPSASTSAQRA